jgi:threonine dehydratase
MAKPKENVMLSAVQTPLIRLGNLFPEKQVYAKCEFLGLAGSFKIRGAVHLLEHLSREGRTRQLVVPSMGNTAIGIAVGARAYGFTVAAVVPQTLSRAKDERLQALGVELIKIAGGGTDLIRQAERLAADRAAYFVHPHLDPLWTDGYQAIMQEILNELPDWRSLVFPVGGGGLLMGLTEFLATRPVPHRTLSPCGGEGTVRGLFGCEAYNYPTYAAFDHPRTRTIAEGLVLEQPHAKVQERIKAIGIRIHLIKDAEIGAAMAELLKKQGLAVEPSSAIATAFVKAHLAELEEPICAILTGENITREDFYQLIKVLQ